MINEPLIHRVNNFIAQRGVGNVNKKDVIQAFFLKKRDNYFYSQLKGDGLLCEEDLDRLLKETKKLEL